MNVVLSVHTVDVVVPSVYTVSVYTVDVVVPRVLFDIYMATRHTYAAHCVYIHFCTHRHRRGANMEWVCTRWMVHC